MASLEGRLGINEITAKWTLCWLIKSKASVRISSQTLKQNTKIISSAISPQQISGKSSESKQNFHEKFSKNLSFGID